MQIITIRISRDGKTSSRCDRGETCDSSTGFSTFFISVCRRRSRESCSRDHLSFAINFLIPLIRWSRDRFARWISRTCTIALAQGDKVSLVDRRVRRFLKKRRLSASLVALTRLCLSTNKILFALNARNLIPKSGTTEPRRSGKTSLPHPRVLFSSEGRQPRSTSYGARDSYRKSFAMQMQRNLLDVRHMHKRNSQPGGGGRVGEAIEARARSRQYAVIPFPSSLISTDGSQRRGNARWIRNILYKVSRSRRLKLPNEIRCIT